MIETWHQVVKSRDVNQLREILAPNVVLHSPVIHTPVKGQQMVLLYLSAALQTFANESFTYVNEFTKADGVVLEFATEIDGIHVNGIDMITWNEQGQIIDFKVMVRPLKAINLINEKMTALLEIMKAKM